MYATSGSATTARGREVPAPYTRDRGRTASQREKYRAALSASKPPPRPREKSSTSRKSQRCSRPPRHSAQHTRQAHRRTRIIHSRRAIARLRRTTGGGEPDTRNPPLGRETRQPAHSTAKILSDRQFLNRKQNNRTSRSQASNVSAINTNHPPKEVIETSR